MDLSDYRPLSSAPGLRSMAWLLRELDKAAQASLLLTLDGSIHHANPVADRMFGYEPGELKGLHLQNLQPGRLRSDHFTALLQQLSDVMRRVRVLGMRKDSIEIEFDADIQQVHTLKGKFLLCTARAVQRDATQSADFLPASVPPWHSIVNELPVSVISVNGQGQILEANHAACQMFGYVRKELVGQSALMLHDHEEVETRAAQISGMGATVVADFTAVAAYATQWPPSPRNWTLVHKDGSKGEFTVSVTPIYDDAGTTCGYLTMVNKAVVGAGDTSLETQAHYDVLTGLPNRALISDRMEVALLQAQRRGSKVALLMLDLDHFKIINDTFGHATGDALLVTLAMRLQSCVRKSDTVARLGGDEFVMLFPDVRDRAELDQMMQNIIKSVSTTMILDGQEINITPSIGCCLSPDDGTDERELMRCADLAMYAAKRSGRCNAKWYADEMAKPTQDSKSLTTSLRRTLANGQLAVHFQPEISLRDGDITGMEALVRWPQGSGGLVRAEHIIAAADNGGFSPQLARWSLQHACEEFAKLHLPGKPGLTLSVNLSSRQFHQLNLPELLGYALLTSGVSARQLNVEVTEETLMQNPEQSTAILEQLRKLGATITVDDFGSGRTSLSCVTGFPIDRIKIARSLVNKLSAQLASGPIIETIIGVADSLHLRVGAVGVETKVQHDFLQERGCREAQGQYYCGAMAVADLSARADGAIKQLWRA